MLKHQFLRNAHDIDGLLLNTSKIATYCSKLEKQSVLHPDRYNPDNYLGNGLEFFAEALIKLSPIDNRIGIGNYELVTENDIGVDGYGIGIDGRPVTVQVKYRGNNEYTLTANKDGLSNFVANSYRAYGVPVGTKNHMLIITTAKGLHYYTDATMYGGDVRCLGYEDLRTLVDNNFLFWDSFRKLVRESL